MSKIPVLIITLSFIPWLQVACGRAEKKVHNPAEIDDHISEHDYARPAWLGLTSFYTSCDDLQSEIAATLKIQWMQRQKSISRSIEEALKYNANSSYPQPIPPFGAGSEIAADSSSSKQVDAASQAPSPASDSFTNVQERSVDEADSVGVGSSQIFTLSQGKIQVVERSDFRSIGALDTQGLIQAQLYAKGSQLIVLGYSQSDDSTLSVVIRQFESTSGALPSLIQEQKFPGSLIETRMIENRLILVVRQGPIFDTEPVVIEDFAGESWYSNPRARLLFVQWFSGLTRPIRFHLDGENSQDISCVQHLRRSSRDFDFSVTKVYSWDLNQGADAIQKLAVIGGADQLYVSPSHLYLLKTNVSWLTTEIMGAPTSAIGRSPEGATAVSPASEPQLAQAALFQDYATFPEPEVAFLQIGFEGAEHRIVPQSQGTFPGTIKDRWSMQERNDGQHLIVAATESGTKRSAAIQNHLYILQRNADTHTFTISAAVKDYGTNETIRAVRFQGDLVYVVTFRQTDPLFAFDVADLKNPQLLSGLKVLGYSSYLHPLDANHLLGVGYDASSGGQLKGVQISLFDVTDPKNMLALEQLSYGMRGSNSAVLNDPHAFFYDPKDRLIGVPLVTVRQDSNYSLQTDFSGAVILGFDGQALTEKARISHSEWISKSCASRYYSEGTADVKRIYRIDDQIVTVSVNGIKAFSLQNFSKPVRSVNWTDATTSCPNQEGTGEPIAL